jgi:hypothetical protein
VKGDIGGNVGVIREGWSGNGVREAQWLDIVGNSKIYIVVFGCSVQQFISSPSEYDGTAEPLSNSLQMLGWDVYKFSLNGVQPLTEYMILVC